MMVGILKFYQCISLVVIIITLEHTITQYIEINQNILRNIMPKGSEIKCEKNNYFMHEFLSLLSKKRK